MRTAETHRYPHGDRIQCVVTVFECTIVGGSLQAGDDEATAHEFRPVSELPSVQRLPPGVLDGSATSTVYHWDDAWLGDS